ncbi:hypothetical protein J2Y83_003208 [Pseudomonas marginalis]|uniref:hypothetical protein n=1 Tax=Pseudomonas marginalis TaxID=298 RepID=UPI00209EE61E|nr:hypothetical protein [Pseudomonas marginalis]MCP1507234.1 hypothetical protein [Pseudomonas marginalis]MCP1524739.1 hypothetical protein [Pseudomonas marginalis]MDQ0502799.1 hypothetical protein [Pseudomonas marginalis]
MPSLKKYFSKGLIAVIAAVGGACLEATTDIIKKNFEPALVSARNSLEDRFSPLPENALIGLSLDFYMPSALGNETKAEGVSASIPGKSCRKPDGHDIVRVFDESANGHRTNAVMIIHCSPSGRVSVSLAPQSGQIVSIYEGRFRDGEKLGFPGVPGSYYAGVLTMHRLDAVEPKGPWMSVNKCQIDNSCKPEDFSIN